MAESEHTHVGKSSYISSCNVEELITNFDTSYADGKYVFFAGFVVCSVFFGICPEYKGFPAQSKNIDHIVDWFIFAVSG